MVDSVIAQTYRALGVVVADGDSTAPHVAPLLHEYAAHDPQIKVQYLGMNRGIAANTNAAIAAAAGDYVAFLDHDDTLAPFALFEVVRALNDHGTADLLYSDEDKIRPGGRCRSRPVLQAGLVAGSCFLCRSMYACHLTVMQSRCSSNGSAGFREGSRAAPRTNDLWLRATEQAHQIHPRPEDSLPLATGPPGSTSRSTAGNKELRARTARRRGRSPKRLERAGRYRGERVGDETVPTSFHVVRHVCRRAESVGA